MGFLNWVGLQTLVTNIKNAVQGGTWLNVKNGSGTGSVVEGNLSGNTASGRYAHAEGSYTSASGGFSHAEGDQTYASEQYSHAEGFGASAGGKASHAEGYYTSASGEGSHAEGNSTKATGNSSHAQGKYNYADDSFIDSVGIGTGDSARKNAEVTTTEGDKYLLGVGNYEGQSTSGANSVQSVISALLTDVSTAKSNASTANSLVKKLNVTSTSVVATSAYTIPATVEIVFFKGRSGTITLPLSPTIGRRVRIMKMTVVNILSKSGVIHMAGDTSTSGVTSVASTASDGYFLWFTFVHDGTAWYGECSK